MTGLRPPRGRGRRFLAYQRAPRSDGERAMGKTSTRVPVSHRLNARAAREMARRWRPGRDRERPRDRLASPSRDDLGKFRANARDARTDGRRRSRGRDSRQVARIDVRFARNKGHAGDATVYPRDSLRTYLRSNLVAALASLDMDDFPHVARGEFVGCDLSRERPLGYLGATATDGDLLPN